MKKFLSLISILFITCFMGILSVSAAGSKMEITYNKKYKYSWNGISDFNSPNYSYKLSCKNVTKTNSIGLSGTKINAIDGYVELEATITNGEISCNIYKDDPASGNPILTSDSISIGTTTTKRQETTSTTVTPTQTTTQAPKSNNANLKTLSVVSDDDSEVTLSPKFDALVYEYETTVPSTVKTIAINATMEDSKANMVISNNVNEELTPGENNKITVTVTAEDGTKKAYVINVKREALTADATLQSLSIKECKSFELKPDKFTYTVKVKKSVKELTLDYVLSDENSSVEIEGNENLKDGSKVKITVTAEDGTKKVYTLTISKEQETTKKDTSNISVEKNPLIIMGLSIIAFGLIGGIIYVIKK